MKDVQLKVMEALQEEAYKGIVRIDSTTMRDIGVRVGDIVEIEGGRVTVGIVDRAYPTEDLTRWKQRWTLASGPGGL